MKLQKNKCLIILMLCLIICLLFGATSFAFASEEPFSNVLSDLSKDPTFALYRYPQLSNDYSLQVIQVAETNDKRLVVYVYQPSGQEGNLRASSINISHTIDGEVQPYNYKLTYCNSEGTLFKYIVEDFYLLDNVLRILDVYSILRPFINGVDTAPSGQSVSEVPFNVSKRYQFTTIDGKYVSHCDKTESLVIDDKFVGFVRYKEGFDINPSACDRHFVAFNVSVPIDKILHARLSYAGQGIVHHYNLIGDDTYDYGNRFVEENCEVDHTEKVVYKGNGFFSNRYEWDKITDINTFLSGFNVKEQLYSGALFKVVATNDISVADLNKLKSKQWVLSFYNSPYTDYSDLLDPREVFTQVYDVMIFELTYEYESKIYNLGVVDNKQTGSHDPINKQDTDIELTDLAKIILFILMIILLIILLWPVMPYVIQFVFWLVSLPFKLIGAIFGGFKKLANRSKERPTQNKSKAVHVNEKNVMKNGKYKR